MHGSHGRERYGISRRDLDSLYPRMRDAHDYLTSRRDADGGDKGTIVNEVVRPLAAAAAGAAVTGLLAGRLNHWNFPGTPLPIGLTLAVAGQVVRHFKLAGPYSRDVGNAGLGAFASWVNQLTIGLGQQLRARAGQPLGPITAGVGACAPCEAAAAAAASPAAVVAPTPMLPPPSVPNPYARPRQVTEAEMAAISHQMRQAA